MRGSLWVQGLGKSYRDWGSELKRMASWFIPGVKPKAEHWVLKDIHFTVNPGEAIGLIGQNGAGKSTLLKLITGTTCPSAGSVGSDGRVAAILELGMGFNPDLTGRQNAHHSAGLMGYSPKEIAAAMDSIEVFAEIGEYFDQPVRTYSSGMQVRVAFSVATAFRPDILIVDEALSVGDTYFQHKSFNRIRELKAAGVSILLVTHSMSDVRSLCSRVILLDQGRICKDGAPDEVVDYYNALIAEKECARVKILQHREQNGWMRTKSGTGEVTVTDIQLKDAHTGQVLSAVQTGQAIELAVTVAVCDPIPKLVLGFAIRDKQGHVVWGTNTQHTQQVQENLKSGDKVVYLLNLPCNLGPGSYSVTTSLCGAETHINTNYEWQDNILVFDVVNLAKPVFIGVNWLDSAIVISRSSAELV